MPVINISLTQKYRPETFGNYSLSGFTFVEHKAIHKAELSKRVKIVTPQEQWVAFGITAKR